MVSRCQERRLQLSPGLYQTLGSQSIDLKACLTPIAHRWRIPPIFWFLSYSFLMMMMVISFSCLRQGNILNLSFPFSSFFWWLERH